MSSYLVYASHQIHSQMCTLAQHLWEKYYTRKWSKAVLMSFVNNCFSNQNLIYFSFLFRFDNFVLVFNQNQQTVNDLCVTLWKLILFC